MKRPPFPAYDGDEPYVFVCYSHAEADTVYRELEWLKEQGFNIWYDEGISPGTVWRDELARAIERAASFLFFVSPSAIESSNCLREVHFALDEDLPIVAVYLEPTELPPGLRLAILHRQVIHRYELPRQEYERKMRRALAHVALEARPRSRPAVPDVSRPDRVLVAVEAVPSATDIGVDELVATITRYISWHGGAFRAAAGQAAVHHQPNYRVLLRTMIDGGGWRLTWQVDHPATGEVVWASRFKEAASDAQAKQERIAEMIAEGVLQHITDDALRGVGDDDAMTYPQLVLSASRLHYLDRPQVTVRERHIARAIEMEPRTGLGYALLAELLSWKLANGISEDAAADHARLHEAAQTALRLDPNDPQVLLSAGLTHCRVLEYTKGLSLIRRSLALAPTVKAKDELARSLCFAGQPEEAIVLFREILDTMPAGHTFPFGRLALAYAQAGHIEAALEHSTLATVHFPDDYYGWIVHANLLAQSGREDEARLALAEARGIVKGLKVEIAIERTEALYGRTPEQRAFLTDGLRRLLVAGAD